MKNQSALDDFLDVACIIGKGFAGELSDAVIANPRSRSPSDEAQGVASRAAPPPPPAAACVRCDGEREVLVKSVVVPCPLCCAGGR